MKPIVIFGMGELAQLAHYYFVHDQSRSVCGFTADRPHVVSETFLGLPVVPFDEISMRFPAQNFDLFIAIGYNGLNRARAEKCTQARALGYKLASYVSSRAAVWQDLVFGENCFIMEGNVIQPFVRLGDNVIIWSSSLVSHHVNVEDNCFISSEVTISGGVTIGHNSFLGVNCTIREHVTVGANCIIGAGSLILQDVTEGSSYVEAETRNSGVPSRRMQSLL